ncbi:MAG TPA: dihydrolipoyl dehydrogenase [Caldithrix abyssi]|uniref:Dihydrolipoyl dehydrogenase n=1 Tax=Caldithrix abyssi TaxID=187145 RepID=A0A7V5PNQ2_CALAY|nr:dihydrolipoyl dehydrogenase [Caldithrix abyssi]
MSQKYDLAIIGSGPGGYVAAIRAAQLKLKTAIIERDKLGGVCLNWGCIPTKALLKSAEVLEEIRQAKSYGLSVDGVRADFPAIIKRSRRVADMNSKGVEFLMKKNKIDVLYGSASFIDKHTLNIVDAQGKKQRITAQHIIIATGGRPKSIPGISIDGEKIISSRQALALEQAPESLIVVGAGAIGVEFAYFYQTMGTKVTVIEMLDSLLPQEDKEITAVLAKSFKKAGIKVHTSARLEQLVAEGEGVQAVVNVAGKKETIRAEKALMAVGVQGNVEGLELDRVQVKNERGFIPVNEWYQTNVPGIYAIGDITGPPLLAHVASHEGIVCVEKIAGVETHPIDYNSIPGCTYCQPQVASIGLTEEQAKEKGYRVKVGRFPYSASGKARAIGARDGLVKLVFDQKYGELLGAHIVGAEATELIAELGMAKALESTSAELFKTMHAHPTLSEMIMEAAGDADEMAIHI